MVVDLMSCKMLQSIPWDDVVWICYRDEGIKIPSNFPARMPLELHFLIIGKSFN